MGFYFIIFILLTVFSAFEVYGLKQNAKSVFFIILSSVLFLLSFIRWETGTDWESYHTFFNYSNQWGLEGEFEWGFARLNEFVKIFFDNYTFLLFIIASALFYFQSSAILRFSPYPSFSLLFLWCIIFANIFFVRQALATVILFFSIRYIQEKKLFPFLLMVGLAMLFHRTSLVFIIAWWIYHLKLRPVVMIACIGISLTLTVALSTLMGSLGSIAGGAIQQKIDFYLDSSGFTFGMENTSLAQIIIKGFANKIFTFAFALFFLKQIEEKGEEFRGYLNLYWISILIYFSMVSISIVLVRLSIVYDMVAIVLIPIILKDIKRLYVRFFLFFIFVCYLFLRLNLSLGSYYDSYVPFKTIF